MSISSSSIPNNVDLESNRKLQKALVAWQPAFLEWWNDMGPRGYQQDDIYLRTAVSVDTSGWAHYDYVKMPDYRWGIFLTPSDPNRTIGFGDNKGKPVWNQVPGEYRKELRRLIVTQCDTEPASVEQQRLLGDSAPSLYDMRNLFQVNVEEGRHLWAMVHLLHEYFGRDGREEAEDMLVRRSGSEDSPRILEAFNKPIDDWLAFFCFTMFTDRDGKFQLGGLAESAFDPLARATRFMLTEEAHHLFVGDSGVSRTIRKTAELMLEHDGRDVRDFGAIPMSIIQKYINEWYSASQDLFGSEDSSNSANFFAASLKGRFGETDGKSYDDNVALEGCKELQWAENGVLTNHEIPLRRAMNLELADSYRRDCEKALNRWNLNLEKMGMEKRIYLPSNRFNRSVGVFGDAHYDTKGNVITADDFAKKKADWLPSQEEKDYVKSVMVPCRKPGEFAPWITPPRKGIKGNPLDFDYVCFNQR
ncbi:MAG: benzoyl-CoA 2,3-epoxidase subunit BoxB [Planctomycetota bacterium]|jgi:benzoyl-CoA 2,3-dioxygenase component B|nr:benzoyl-CoA 2,3-epoxidase subunit BoxB [Planctomycetota bacterium]